MSTVDKTTHKFTCEKCGATETVTVYEEGFLSPAPGKTLALQALRPPFGRPACFWHGPTRARRLMPRFLMATSLAASVIDLLLGLQLGSPDPGNRFSLEGLTLRANQDGVLEIGIEKFEAVALRLVSGTMQLDVGRLALHQLTGQVRVEGRRPRLDGLQAAHAELSGVKLRGPLIAAPAPGDTAGQPAADSWSLGPLAGADGTIRAEIIDAHLAFDADVTVPIRQGQVDFSDATVEHVGPDSRMGVGQEGLYVDAPNGRSYLYHLPAGPVAGVEYEQRDALLGPWVSRRGALKLQAFAEGLLTQARGTGFTAQARQLFDRTALAGEVRLGDGRFAAPGVQADFVGGAEGRNVVRLHSEAVGRGFTAEVASLSVQQAAANPGGMQLACADMTGKLMVRVFADGAQLRFELDLEDVRISGLRVNPGPPDAV